MSLPGTLHLSRFPETKSWRQSTKLTDELSTSYKVANNLCGKVVRYLKFSAACGYVLQDKTLGKYYLNDSNRAQPFPQKLRFSLSLVLVIHVIHVGRFAFVCSWHPVASRCFKLISLKAFYIFFACSIYISGHAHNMKPEQKCTGFIILCALSAATRLSEETYSNYYMDII